MTDTTAHKRESQQQRVDWWHLDTQDVALDSPLVSEYRALLSAPEATRMARLVSQVDQHRYLLTRALVRTTLSSYVPDTPPAEWTFSTGVYGRPSVNQPESARSLQFNLSHSGHVIDMAVSTVAGDFGIDVEQHKVRERSLRVARRFFSEWEYAALAALPDDQQQQRFFDLWTLKEAYVKALGRGLSFALLKQFGFGFTGKDTINFDSTAPGDASAHWQFLQIDRGAGLTTAFAHRAHAPKPGPLTVVMHHIVPLSSHKTEACRVIRATAGAI